MYSVHVEQKVKWRGGGSTRVLPQASSSPLTPSPKDACKQLVSLAEIRGLVEIDPKVVWVSGRIGSSMLNVLNSHHHYFMS